MGAIFLFSGLILPAILYSLFLQWLSWHFRRIPSSPAALSALPDIPVSILIAARNEEDSVQAVIEAILSQDYPRDFFEVIIVDDHSEDQTFQLASAYADCRLSVYKLESGYGKKAALELAVARAKGDLLLFTDADCIPSPSWVRSMVGAYSHMDCRLLAGPVVYASEDNVLSRFQALDAAGMMALTAVGLDTSRFFLANGANLACEKSLFDQIGGYASHADTPSGDDVLLVNEVANRNRSWVGAVTQPSASIRTFPEPSWTSMIQQRLRWASKSAHYQFGPLGLVQSLVFVTSLSIPFSLLLAPFFGWHTAAAGATSFLLKTLSDYHWLRLAVSPSKRHHLLHGFIFSECLHIASTISVGVLTLAGQPLVWKGRPCGYPVGPL
jgi:cellulose synthase/poly-beta-1,6-N-acetylglucosamine synthase-like glycosyltransferase